MMKRTEGDWDYTADRKIMAGGKTIAQVLRPEGMDWHEAEANLRAIVKAVNEHDNLLVEVAHLRQLLERQKGGAQ